MPSRDRMSIGDVLQELRSDFPDITVSKIRYLESEGLVEPERTPSGYRKFSTADVERLRYVLTMQRDRFYPLREIRKNLEAMDRGLTPQSGSEDVGTPTVPKVVLSDDGYPTGDSFRPSRHEIRLSRAELLEAAEIGTDLLDAMEQFGLMRPRASHQHYDGVDVAVAKTVGELAAYGVEPRHLRAFKTAADREVGLFEQIVSTQQRPGDPSATARAEETIRELAALSVRLHTTLVKHGLQKRD
ncbi:transcriptional regulator FtsR [Solicola gregarius]|uniref:MerR family transcriptional regulator n=1 Tax=Solicola gregarius TaxID=2908642 RepID=A0AA46YK62_9ACTN|nr:MerR family transcriptional regulator [Solicola gregarius]UYM05142.1 MerR family transcriptional regulator [Solicola gregarius]